MALWETERERETFDSLTTQFPIECIDQTLQIGDNRRWKAKRKRRRNCRFQINMGFRILAILLRTTHYKFRGARVRCQSKLARKYPRARGESRFARFRLTGRCFRRSTRRTDPAVRHSLLQFLDARNGPHDTHTSVFLRIFYARAMPKTRSLSERNYEKRSDRDGFERGRTWGLEIFHFSVSLYSGKLGKHNVGS